MEEVTTLAAAFRFLKQELLTPRRAMSEAIELAKAKTSKRLVEKGINSEILEEPLNLLDRSIKEELLSMRSQVQDLSKQLEAL